MPTHPIVVLVFICEQSSIFCHMPVERTAAGFAGASAAAAGAGSAGPAAAVAPAPGHAGGAAP